MNANTSFDAAASPMGTLETLPADGTGKTILCDINGTLFTVAGLDMPMNRVLMTFLAEAQKRNYAVFLHSANAGNNQSLLDLAAKTNPEFGGFLQDLATRVIAREIANGERDQGDDETPNYAMAKGDIRFNDAYLMIDDEHYNTTTPIWSPLDARIRATLKSWDVDVPVMSQRVGPGASGTRASGPK